MSDFLVRHHTIPVKDNMDNDELLKVSLMKEIIKPTKPHRHAGYHELILLSQGGGYHEIDDQIFEVRAPELYYLRPGQTHCWNFSAIPKGYVILFREELLWKEDIDELYTFPPRIDLNNQPFLFNLLQEFYNEFKNQHVGTDVYRAYLHLLLTKIKQLCNNNNHHKSGSDSLFHAYKRLVNDHFIQNKPISFYAGLLNITTAVLNETCKKTANKTALAIINERTLLEAKLLLSATGKPVSLIAHELSFADSPHFNKFFKLHTNITPGRYRELAMAKK